jgi:uncharacterized protein
VPDIPVEGNSAFPTAVKSAHPDYVGLVRFLVVPFLEVPEALKVDCEISQVRSRVWVRLAFEASDKGRVFGRGGRNIQAIRTVLDGIAKADGFSVHLDVFGSTREAGGESDAGEQRVQPRRAAPSKAVPSKAAPKLRPRAPEGQDPEPPS